MRPARSLRPGALRPTDLLGAFVVVAIAFLLAGAAVAALHIAGALGWYGQWLALHLLLLGGVSLLVLGVGQFFCTAFLATDPPARGMVRAQLAAWSTGAVLVAVGVPTAHREVTDLGGLAVLAGLVLFASSLSGLERRSLRRARWAIRWYYACATSLGLGALIGILMARGTPWPYGDLLGAHLALNLAGWLGTAIVGTLHTFYPSLTHTHLRHPRLQGPTFGAWTAGVGALAAGWAFDLDAAIAAGWIALGLGAALLAVNLFGCARDAEGPLGLAPRLVGTAQGFLVAGLLVALALCAASGPRAPLEGASRSVLAVLLLAGWVALTVSGSLLHLLAVLHRVRHLTSAMPAVRPVREGWLTALIAAAVAALALSRAPGLAGLDDPATVAALAAAALIAGRVLVLAARALRFAGLRA